MKTKSLLFAVLMVLGTVSLVNAEHSPAKTGMAVVAVKGSETFKVIYKGETAGRVKLNIYGPANELVMTQTFNNVDGFILPVNFAGLRAGAYSIELTNAAGTMTEKVAYRLASPANVHVSQVKNEQGKYLLSVTSKEAGQITVNIYDAGNTLIHSETRAINAPFAQVYKLLTPSSSYTFVVSDSTGNSTTISF